MANNSSKIACASPKRIVLYCRMPGLLIQATREGGEAHSSLPLLVAAHRKVRDVCPVCLAYGIVVGSSVRQARYLCPVATVVPYESIDPQKAQRVFLDRLADLSSVIEPVCPDTAFVELHSSVPVDRIVRSLTQWGQGRYGVAPVLGIGGSKIAARACAECGLLSSQLAVADVSWLWLEDERIPARLKRLGLNTFGSVAEVREDLLVHQFGKMGRLLYRRAQGIDLDPVRPLYPPPRANASIDLSEYPASNTMLLQAALIRAITQVSEQLVANNRHGRRVLLRLVTEKGEMQRERVLESPVQSQTEIQTAVRSLTSQMHFSAAIVAMHLIVEDSELPVAKTLSLFADKVAERETVIKVVRRTLQTRFGTKALLRLSELPVPLREERRMLMKEVLLHR